MGAKGCFVCYSDANIDVAEVLSADPILDRQATAVLVRRLFPGYSVTSIGDGTLAENAAPPPDDVFAGVWPGVAIVCTMSAAPDRPSELAERFVQEGAGRTVSLHAMHSVVDWFGYAIWSSDGQLRRSLSVSPDHLVIEDVGAPLTFEDPFWNGDFPATEEGDYPLPFHPLELAEAALDDLFGFVIEGYSGMAERPTVDPFDVTLAGFHLRQSPRRRFLWR